MVYLKYERSGVGTDSDVSLGLFALSGPARPFFFIEGHISFGIILSSISHSLFDFSGFAFA